MKTLADDLESRVMAFELALRQNASPQLHDYLPSPESSNFLPTCCELACAEFEWLYQQSPLAHTEYIKRYPAFQWDSVIVATLHSVEQRLRNQYEQTAEQTHLVTGDWRQRINKLYDAYREQPEEVRTCVVDPVEMAGRLLQNAEPAAHAGLPKIGHDFLGFQLVRELGRGSFGRVFLARQQQLADRLVVLKIGTRLFDESTTLAQLQHTNIVPIYSAYSHDGIQTLCMPFLGSTTLADVLAHYHNRHHSSNVVISTLNLRRASTVGSSENHQPALGQPATHKPEMLAVLETMPHDRLVLWLGVQLADALAHAHDRSIIHRDIKPENILIADDGTPLLLDFNLSAAGRYQSGNPALLGGTIPYMAPEQLEAFMGKSREVDARSDLYSLGLVLFELLCGERPFPVYREHVRTQIPRLLADRTKAAPRARRIRKTVSPAVEAILAKCLEPNPAQRYQNAQELREDLQCQLDNRPLQHTREPSVVEATKKFIRRQRRAIALSGLAVFACLTVVTITLLFYQREQTRHAQAQEQYQQFRDEVLQAEMLLGLPQWHDASEGEKVCKTALARFDWNNPVALQRLSAEQQAEVRDSWPKLQLLLARAIRVQADGTTDPKLRAERLAEAMEWNRQLQRVPENKLKRASLLQQALLLRKSGNAADAERVLRQARELPSESQRDRWLEVGEAVERRDWTGAEEILDELTRHEPTQAVFWAVRGRCAEEQADFHTALRCYTTLRALTPTFTPVLLWIARCEMELKQFHHAQKTLQVFSKSDPQSFVAQTLNAIVAMEQHDYRRAIEFATEAIDAGSPETRLYFIRARAWSSLGERTKAQADLKRGLEATPSDELSWIARGVIRQATKPVSAIEDFEQALVLNPRSRVALQNKAATLSEFLNKPAEAVLVLDELLAIHPNSVESRIGRAVLQARLGAREKAHADVVAALQRDQSAATLYRAGCAYALTAKTHPEDMQVAIRYLTAAILAGADDDLRADRDLEVFHRNPAALNPLLKLQAEVFGKKSPISGG